MTAPLLKIGHLEVRYGDLIGVSDVSLDVPEGSVVALLGSNGGGKTTVLNAIAGLIGVHSGSPATLTMLPAEADTGILFIRCGTDGKTQARQGCQVEAG